MSFAIPSLDEIHALLVNDYANRFPGADTSRYSNAWKRLRVVALAVSGLHYHIDSVYRDLLPDRATGAELDAHGYVHGVTRKAATAAHETAALRVYGSESSSVVIGDLLSHADGTSFQVNENATIGAGETYVDVDVLAVTTGSVGLKEAGEILTFTSPPSGIQSVAELQLDIGQDGDDDEDDGAYRTRILDRVKYPGMGGNANDYRTWAEEQSGIAHGYPFPLRQGLGTVDLAALHSGSGAERLLSSDERTALFDAIELLRPVSVDFAVLTVAAEPCDVEVTVEPEDSAAYAFDWDDETPLIVSSWTAGTRVLKFTTDVRSDMAVGDRIVYKRVTSTVNDGHEAIIEALGPNDDEVTLVDDDELATSPPVATNNVYSGGPLVSVVREAIIALFDSMGPGRGEFAAGTWEGSLRLSSLFKVVQLSAGVLDTTIVAPTANVDGTNTTGSTIGLVTPRQVLVRRRWA